MKFKFLRHISTAAESFECNLKLTFFFSYTIKMMMMNASFVESLHYSRVLATLLDYCLRFLGQSVSSAATALWN